MTMTIGSIDIEVIRTVFVFIFLWRNFKHLKHKQKHLSNIQPDISKQKSIQVTFIQTNMYLSI